MSSSSRIQELDYLYASNTNVSNFVSVKLSGNNNYHVWRSQMLCLLDSNNMGGIVDASFVGPKCSDTDTLRQYESLARGWILGSVSEDLLTVLHSLGSAKAVWDKLKSIYDSPKRLQEDSTLAKANTTEEDKNLINIIVPTENEHEQESEEKKILHKYLRAAIIKGKWRRVEMKLVTNIGIITEAISDEGSTLLHIAAGIASDDFVTKMVSYMNDEQVLIQRQPDESTALHIAASVGKKHAAEVLVKKNKTLLQIKDHKGELPLKKAYENMHLGIIEYLVNAMDNDDEIESLFSLPDSDHPDEVIGARLLVNAISAKEYGLASMLVKRFPKFASKTDNVLMTIAKTFPMALDYGETFIYPSLDVIWLLIQNVFPILITILRILVEESIYPTLAIIIDDSFVFWKIVMLPIYFVFSVVTSMLVIAFMLILLFGMIICLLLLVPYFLLWKGAKMLAVPPIKGIERKKKEWDEATKLLKLVCKKIDNSKDHHHYNQPILEAASQNAYKVVDEILSRSPEAIHSKDKNEYDIIQLAIRNRSEKIYNLIYDVDERKNLYRMYEDSLGNNILHMAGKLTSSSVLNRRTGAALQLQRELQWHEEVKKLVFPTYITKENIFGETPDMVFTREHENLVKEGEQWMKTTAESCSIAAALITTIVFAAAITVPGGSDQTKGTPLFKKEPAFIVFAISDAISLFASSTSLLVFLSVLTARFSEKDFLFSLPNKLFIGLFSLLLSTIFMMIAFSATLYLVFCHKKLWMLAPICVLAFIPIAFFVGLQFSLMLDLFKSTYLSIFGKQKKGILSFTLDDIGLRFGKRN